MRLLQIVTMSQVFIIATAVIDNFEPHWSNDRRETSISCNVDISISVFYSQRTLLRSNSTRLLPRAACAQRDSRLRRSMATLQRLRGIGDAGRVVAAVIW